MRAADDNWATRPYAIYVLGAGFSKPAGLPLANELWREVCSRASTLTDRMAQFREDLEDFIKFKLECDGKQLTPETVDLEEFLGFLDVEFHLNLRGSDTWSADGNEAQVVAKTLIGQVLAERMPSREAIPSLYLNFVRKLRPGDTILTFNYDVVLEHAMELAEVPFRLFPFRYTEVYSDGRGVVEWRGHPYDEVVILKLHGSIDWFDRRSFTKQVARFEQKGIKDRPEDPVFNGPQRLRTVPLIDGLSHASDPLHEMHRLVDFERFYANPPWFMAVPTLINPSTAKLIFAGQFSDFWSGLGRNGGGSYKLVIIGFSMPQHDDYARQVIYRLAKNYQQVHYDPRKPKAPILLIDYRENECERAHLLKRYAFLDPAQSEFNFEGFTQSVVDRL